MNLWEDDGEEFFADQRHGEAKIGRCGTACAWAIIGEAGPGGREGLDRWNPPHTRRHCSRTRERRNGRVDPARGKPWLR